MSQVNLSAISIIIDMPLENLWLDRVINIIGTLIIVLAQKENFLLLLLPAFAVLSLFNRMDRWRKLSFAFFMMSGTNSV